MRVTKFLLHFIFLILYSVSFQICNSQNIEIHGPAGSENFGDVKVLPNGNYIVADPLYDEGAVINVGAVYLYNGSTHALISTLKGSSANDRIGRVTILTNGNYLVSSTQWKNAGVSVGAVTWCSGVTGLSGVVSSSNSLIGSRANDMAQLLLYPLTNGNYVVGNKGWANGAAAPGAGAVTWGNGNSGISGAISASNSLVGVSSLQGVGGVIVLSNGNYVVQTSNFVTWCNGLTGRTGSTINSTNSLASPGDVIPLTNGNYIVVNQGWDNGAVANVGAVTWCNGSTGRIGSVTAANSFVGSQANDLLGASLAYALSNGNYVVTSPYCNNGAIVDAGAATWFDGSTATIGTVSISNSLMGSTTNDNVGSNGITALSNGNYVVNSPLWNNGSATAAGAATFCSGTTTTSGIVSIANSLVGSTTNDNVGVGSTKTVALTNGNYVVPSYLWDNGIVVDAGAVTWGNGTTGTSGVIGTSNSLVGSTANDNIGYKSDMGFVSVIPLTNGNYVIGSPLWDKGSLVDVGASTWCDGTGPTSGVVSEANSLIGSKNNDYVGMHATALSNGNYLVNSFFWNNMSYDSVGAVTWCNGTGTTSAIVSGTNSLVGNNGRQIVGYLGITALSGGRYFVLSKSW
ncbi:MAG: hypothetical protein ABIN74_11610, partial [Ferruginibacter sp.]